MLTIDNKKPKEKKSPEQIALNLLLFAFIIGMAVFAVFRFCGLAWFTQEPVPTICNERIYYIVSSALHIFEGYVILRILTRTKWYNCLLIAVLYDALFYFIPMSANIQFACDVLYMTSIPFIFNNNKEKSILSSCLLILGLSAYQLAMSFSRYSMSLAGKYDVSYALLSLIDYRCFLIILLLISKKLKRRE